MKRHYLFILFALLATIPAISYGLAGTNVFPAPLAIIFGLAMIGYTFILSWGKARSGAFMLFFSCKIIQAISSGFNRPNSGRMKRTVFLYLASALVWAVFGFPALVYGKTNLLSIDQRKETGFRVLVLNFDQTPKYTIRELENPTRIELLLLSTVTELGEENVSLSTPIAKLSIFKGAENLSVSIALVGKVPYFCKSDSTRIQLFFPSSFQEQESFLLDGEIPITIERRLNGEKFTELYWVRISPEQVSRRLKIVSASALGTKRLSVNEIAERLSALVAVNGGFFDSSGNPVGLLIVDGKLLALPAKGKRAAFIIERNGNVLITRPTLSIWLEVDGKRIRADGFNQPLAPGKVVVYNHLFPRQKLIKDALYFRLQDEKLLPISLEEIQNLVEDAIFIGESLTPEADPFRGKDKITFNFALSDDSGRPLDVLYALEGAPLLVKDSVVSIDASVDELSAQVTEGVRARTAIGIDAKGGVVILVVKEDKDTGVKGMSLQELAEKILSLGAINALNLDGGGSSVVSLKGIALNQEISLHRKIPSAIVIL